MSLLFLFTPAEVGANTGTLTKTLAPATLVATGSLAIQGSLAATLDDVTLASAPPELAGAAGIARPLPITVRGALVAAAPTIQGEARVRLPSRGRLTAPVATISGRARLRLTATAALAGPGAARVRLGRAVVANPGQHVYLIEADAEEDVWVVTT